MLIEKNKNIKNVIKKRGNTPEKKPINNEIATNNNGKIVYQKKNIKTNNSIEISKKIKNKDNKTTKK